MNTLKLKVVVLCFFFFTVGYIVATFNTKAKTHESKVLTENKLPEYSYEEPVTVYQIKYGDTLDSIAKLFGITKEALMKENGLKLDEAFDGGWLRIPK